MTNAKIFNSKGSILVQIMIGFAVLSAVLGVITVPMYNSLKQDLEKKRSHNVSQVERVLRMILSHHTVCACNFAYGAGPGRSRFKFPLDGSVKEIPVDVVKTYRNTIACASEPTDLAITPNGKPVDGMTITGMVLEDITSIMDSGAYRAVLSVKTLTKRGEQTRKEEIRLPIEFIAGLKNGEATIESCVYAK